MLATTRPLPALVKLQAPGAPLVHRSKFSARLVLAAGAYQTFRSMASSTQRMKPLKEEPIVRPTPVPAEAAQPAAAPQGPAPTVNAAANMNTKAVTYYRKAELALKRGDLKSALLQVKLAIAADPASGFLRSALAEIELELKKP